MKTYFPTINLLRGLAALFVCLFHFIHYQDQNGAFLEGHPFILDFGTLCSKGVYIFFVISGFVIPFALYNSNFTWEKFPIFLFRRFIRIEIPYIVSILLILLVGFVFAMKNQTSFDFSLERFFYHLFYLIPYTDHAWYNVIYWTLAIEFQFYILMGLTYLLLTYKNEFFRIGTILLLGASAFLVKDDRFIFYFMLIFLQGIILFLIKTEKMEGKKGFVLILLASFGTAYLNSIFIAIFALSTVFFIHLVDINRKMTNRFGEVSYSLYLIHGLVGGNFLFLFGGYFTSFPAKIFLLLLTVAFVFLVSFIFCRYIETPAREWAKKWK